MEPQSHRQLRLRRSQLMERRPGSRQLRLLRRLATAMDRHRLIPIRTICRPRVVGVVHQLALVVKAFPLSSLNPKSTRMAPTR